MCGIAGFETRGDDRGPVSASLLESLRSRGPDGEASVEVGGWCLAQTRLAVIDLSDRVAYPMRNEGGDLHLLFNGEVYDHRELRRDLERMGHGFKTDCDAEVVLHGFEEWGTGVFGRLNGMFACALLDERTGELTLARDRLGIKPLARTSGERFAFASDAMSLVAAGLSPGWVDSDAIAEYAAFHYVPHPRTGIAGIEQVEPGTAVTRSRDGSVVTTRWTSAPFSERAEGSPVPDEEVERVLRESVRRQLAADVDVGVFLSSGVDSSLVAAMAAGEGVRPRAFTLGFPGHGGYDEAGGAGRLAQSLGLEHFTGRLELDFRDSIEGLAAAYDQPFADSSALATLALARLARREVTVALSGTGGDDLFAGYYRHRAHRLSQIVSMVPDRLLKRIADAPLERGAERSGRRALLRSYAIRLAGASGSESGRYLDLVGASTTSAAVDAMSCSADAVALAREDVARRLGLADAGGSEALRAIQRFELASYVPGDLLTKEDRATMAVGLEGRVPMLDREMVSLAERMPSSQKARMGRGKLPLRSVAGKHLPRFVGRGPKKGFAVPLRDLFAGPWREPAIEHFSAGDSTLVDGAKAASLVTRSPSVAPDVWALATLVGWEARLASARTAAPGALR